MRQLLLDLGVNDAAIVVEAKCHNTYENALTSATHMERAFATFVRQGFAVVPATTDTLADTFPTQMPLSILPSVRALEATTDVVKEWVGLLSTN